MFLLVTHSLTPQQSATETGFFSSSARSAQNNRGLHVLSRPHTFLEQPVNLFPL